MSSYRDEMLKEMEKHGVPEHCREGLAGYIVDRHPVGSFLQAVISNDLRETFARADETNARHVMEYVRFLYNEAPAGCWGSPEKYKAWIATAPIPPRRHS